MFAVIKTGGKQYKVAKDDIIKVEKLGGEAGQNIDLDQVLMVGEGNKVTVGSPLVDGASVQAEVLEQGRGDKIIVFKRKRRKDYRRTKGHRQDLTVLRVTNIAATPGAKQAAPKKAAAKKASPEKAEAKPPAEPKKTEAEAKPAPKKAAPKKPAPKKTEAKAKAAPKKKAAADKPAAKKKAAPKKKAPAKAKGKEK